MMDLVKVEVLETSHTGVWVRILDGDLVNRLGFIRRAELSWDQRPDVEPPWPQIGDTLTARVLGSRNARYVRLSLRLGDPWQDQGVEERFEEGQVVQGQVVQLSRRHGAFVQLVPGVDAQALPATIPLLPGQRLEDVLSVGDEVQAVITTIDPRRRKIEISLTERLRQLSLLGPEERRLFQLSLFQNLPPAQAQLPRLDQNTKENNEGKRRLRRQYPSLEKLDRVLIVEDNEADRNEMVRCLAETFGVQVEGVKSGQEAMERATRGIEYDLALIDVNLPDENAVDLAVGLKNAQPRLVVVFISHDPKADDNLPGDCIFVLKDQGFRSILQFIARIRPGESQQTPETDEETHTSTGDFVRHLGMEAFARRSLEETLRPMLHRLRLQTRVSQVIVFRVDSEEKEVSIVAMDPVLEENTQRYLLDRLYYSPVQNVVEDEEPYYETDTTVRLRHPRFKRLYQVLPFRSCLGLPLRIPDLETCHALFLFDDERPRLELEDLDNARLAARFLEVALERAAFFDFMQRYEARYSRGLLIGSLMHELGVKLNTLESLVERLPAALEKVRDAVKPTERSEAMQTAREIAEELRENRREFAELVDAYQQMARGNWEPVDVNGVVEKVKVQMNKLAEEAEIAIHIEAGAVPPARAISSRLEQILLNLVLNAIQQIDRQREEMARLPKRKKEDPDLLQKGQIIIQTRLVETDLECPIQILVIDTGPGVRYPDRKRIFRLDTTTREKGHGWGLFISHNLVEILHGRLRLAGSVRFIGSVFAVELPSFASRGGA